MDSWPARILRRARHLMRRSAAEQEMAEEMRLHLELEIEERVKHGMTPDEARRTALVDFGGVENHKEDARTARGVRPLEDFSQDVEFALRTFRRVPLFVVVVAATIGVGLGLLATAFTLFDAYVLRPQAVRDPQALYDITWRSRNGAWHGFNWDGYVAVRGERGVLADAFAFANVPLRVQGRPMFAQFVSTNYFEMLGVPPAIGRTLSVGDDDGRGAAAEVVLSHRTWRVAFGGDSSVVGSRIRLNGASFVIVGVAREGFGGLGEYPFDFWAPVATLPSVHPADNSFGPAGGELLRVVGRLRPAVTLVQLRDALGRLISARTSERATDDRFGSVLINRRGTPIPLTPELLAVVTPIAIAFVLVMLIACANVANMMLARGMARQREIGIRLALGAGRGRLVRQLLTESLLLSVPAAALGFVVSRVTLTVGVNFMFATVPEAFRPYLHVIPLAADWRVIAFMTGAAVVSALAFGLAPALQATKPDVVHASRGDFDTRYRPSRLRGALVIAQITLSVLLLITAGVLLGSARRTSHFEPGFRTSGVVQIEPLARARGPVIARLRDERTVIDVAGVRNPPLDGGLGQQDVTNGTLTVAGHLNVVSPEYFGLLGIPVTRGRSFSAEEARSLSPVVVVSEGAAAQLWPGKEPVGQRLTMVAAGPISPQLRRYRSATVIGVAANVTPGSIADAPTSPTLYYPQPIDSSSTLLVRVRGDAEAALANLDRTLVAMDSASVQEAHTLTAALAVQVYPFRAAYWVASLLGITALLLTLTGIYGVLSYIVAQRTREFGIRMALGARALGLVGVVLGQSMRLAIVGVGLGTALALAVSRLLASVVVVIDPFDAPGYVIGISLVLVSCAIAAYVPSQRAALIDPMTALRADS